MTLIEKLEAATGPDRGLDAEIAVAVRWTPALAEKWLVNWDGAFAKLPNSRGMICAMHSNGSRGPNWTVPQFTASINAAMNLISDDFYLELKGPRKYLNIPAPVPNYWSVNLSKFNYEPDVMGWGETAALAICIAAIKAREGDEG